MTSLLIAVFAAYVTAAIHSVLAFAYKRQSLERTAFLSLLVGFCLHTAALILDWVRDGHYPFFGLKEAASFLAWTLVATYGLTAYRYRTPSLGAFTTPLISLLTLVAILYPLSNSTSASTVLGNGDTWLLPLHTTLISFAYACFFFVFVTSVMYLLQERELKLKTFSAVFHRLPSLNIANEIATSAAGLGATLLTLGIVAGMVWSSKRDGKIWHNDPKEVLSGLTLLLYLSLVLYRSTSGWRGRRAAWLGVAGFCLVLFTFISARLLGSYHVFG